MPRTLPLPAALLAALLAVVATAAVLASPAAAATSVALTSSANPSVTGQRITLRAVVADPPAPTSSISGSVAFSDGATILATVPVSSGRATLATGLDAGTHDLVAAFTPTGAAGPAAAGALSQVVRPADTTIALAATRPTANYGDGGQIAATVRPVAPGRGVATGTVDFSVDGGFFESVPVDATGRAVLPLAHLYPSFSPGTYTVTAAYTGDAGFNASSSGPVAQTFVGITSEPVSMLSTDAAGRPTFSPAAFTMSSLNPVGCNVTITNTTSSSFALLYGTPGSWKRLPFGTIPAGGSRGVGVGIGGMTGYFTVSGASNFVALRCR